MVTADQPAPAYFTYDAVLNTKERPTLEDTLERVLKPLTLEDSAVERRRGADSGCANRMTSKAHFAEASTLA